MARFRVLDIRAEVALALELETVFRLCIAKGWLGTTTREYLQGVRIDVVEEARAVFGFLRVRRTEQTGVQTHFALDAGGGRHPVDHALDLAAFRVLAQGFWIIRAAQFDDVARGVLDRFVGADHVAAAQAHFAGRFQALVAFWRLFHEVVTVDVDFTGERQCAHAHVFFRVAWQFEVLDLAFRVVGDHDFQRAQHAHGARGAVVEVVTDAEFEHAEVDHAVGTVGADHFAEVADGLGRVAATAEARQRRHARVVPAVDVLFIHQLLELALAGDGVVQVQAAEFVLARVCRNRQVLQEPFVQRTVTFELQGADGVGDAFDGVRLAVGEVVVRVDAPLVTGLVVMGMADAVHDRVAQVHVRRGHVDLGTQYTGTVCELTGAHAGEPVQVLFHRTVAERAVLARFGQRATVFLGLFRGEVVDVGLAGLDQHDGPVEQLVEILGRIAHFTGPFEAQPLDVAFDGVDVFLVFLGRVGIVETQVRDATELLGQTEVHTDRLGVTDVQVAVGLRRKARDDLRVLARIQVRLDDRAQEIDRGGRTGLGVRGRVDSGLAHIILEQTSTWPWAGQIKQRAYHSRSGQPPDRVRPKTAALIARAVKNHLEIPAGHAK